ncbi:MAG: TolC family protein, partial [Bacteroidales bacterium]|nr:TolC family protein [Bacteroidales bacterium]
MRSFFVIFSVVLFSLFVNINQVYSQERYMLTMTLEEVTETAKEQSQAAMLAKHNFLINYWQFRSYKATLLPSLNLNASLGQYNRSLQALRNSETGEYNYVTNNNLSNSLSLSIDQNIALTGGRISLITSLNRIDQFSPIDNILYNSQPVKINYSQPIKAYNSLKWDKIIEPKYYERAKRNYLESMEQINITAVNLFFKVLSDRINLEMAQQTLESTTLQLEIA